jgi:hypothetical protein
MLPATLNASNKTSLVGAASENNSKEISITLDAMHATYDTNTKTIKAEKLKLHLSNPHGLSPEISAKSILCTSEVCTLNNVRGTICPHHPAGFYIKASKAIILEEGDIVLYKPILYISKTPVIIIPKIHLLPLDKTGFMAPVIGWSEKGGFNLGPKVYFPLDKKTAIITHIAARTKEGMDASLFLDSTNTTASVDYLLSHKKQMARFKMKSHPHLKNANSALLLDIATNKRIINDLSFLATERAKTHTQTLGRLSFDRQTLMVENNLEFFQHYIGTETTPSLNLANIAVTGNFFPIVNSGFIFPTLKTAFNRYFINNQIQTTGQSRMVATPALNLEFKAGIFKHQTQVSTRHILWLPDNSDKSYYSHAIGASTGWSLPFAGTFKRYRHILELKAAYRIVPLQYANLPKWQMDDIDRTEKGHGMEIGITNLFSRPEAQKTGRLNLFAKTAFKGFGTEHYTYIELLSAISSKYSKIDARINWDIAYPEPSYASLNIHTKDKFGNGFSTGLFYTGKGKGSHTERWLVATEPFCYKSIVAKTDEQIILKEGFIIELTQFLEAKAGAQFTVYPTAGLNSLYYQLAFKTRCNCLSMGITASHRAEHSIPDVKFFAVLKP